MSTAASDVPSRHFTSTVGRIVLAVLLVGCPGSGARSSTPTIAVRGVATAVSATASAPVPAPPTPVPSRSAVATVAPSPSSTLTVVAAPAATPTPTPEPESEPVAWYIDSLASHPYHGCCIERRVLYERAAAYSMWRISYKSEDLTITGLMAVPATEGRHPAIIVNHGFFPSNDYDSGYDTIRELRFFASNGYVAVAPDYRNYAGSDPGDNTFVPGYVYDVRNLLKALSQLPEVDPGQITMMGHSMGGGITVQCLVSGADIKAAALFGTVSSSQAEYWDAKINRYGGGQDALRFSGRYGTPEQRPEIWAKMSPSNYWDRVQVTVIVHHGDADTTTPIQWSEEVVNGLKAAGKRVEFYVYPGSGHSLNDGAFDLAMQRTLAFFNAALAR